jgi:anti-sigma factor ChrR (cupin superfamily)
MEIIHNIFDEYNWEKATNYPNGTMQKTLRDDENGKTIMLKIPKGFKMPLHSHIYTEQHFVLDGTYKSEGIVYPKGSYQIYHTHEEHGPFESKNGALILVIWDK